jgi:hypothetical protein
MRFIPLQYKLEERGHMSYVIKKWRQSEIQQVEEAKAPPPRSHGKLGDTVGGQCSAVR